ncbi:MAG: ATP-dependent RNA helicase HrpA [bacterium]|nr:ATP-dependent RNA helicase HrpA [bacterium]
MLSEKIEKISQKPKKSSHQRRKRASLCSAQPVSITYPADLPIVAKRAEIIQAILKNQVLIITGDTGSGKTTQIPKMCLEAGRGRAGKIGCTQPRRLAAMSVARRVAEELGDVARELVGYQIRFQDRTSPKTRIKFMTDGILLAETQSDPSLFSYDTIIIDEAHERSLNIDFLLGILRQLLVKRKDLKVIITSATIDTEKFSQSFGEAPVIEVSGRRYPVEVWYRPIDHELEDAGDITYIDQAIKAVEELKRQRRQGDILIFMPTERDIRETQQRLEGRQYPNTLILPLLGRLTADEQSRVFQPVSEQKIVIATNVAETSITVPGIKYVIDTGLARISQYNARTRTQSLPIQPISRSSADQRKGRCGRTESGICIRLYSEAEYLEWPQFTPPEIKRSNLARVILQMVFLNLGNVATFPFIDPPTPSAIRDGYATLRELGALDAQNKLTPIGRMMARLPLDPRIARMLIEAKKEGAIKEVAIIAAALSIQDPRERPLEQEAKADEMHAGFREQNSDFLTLLKIWNTYHQSWEKLKTQNQMRKFCKTHFLSYNRMREWQDIHEQILTILAELGDYPLNQQPASYEAIHRSILSGLLSHVAQRIEDNPREKNLYRTSRGREVMIFPGSGQFGKAGPWIVAAELVRTSRLFARIVATIQPEWLESLAGNLCKRSYFDPHWEKDRGQVVVFERVSLYGLIIVPGRKVNYGSINPQEAHEIFIRSALVEGQVKEKFFFLEHNQRLIEQIEELEDKTRRRDMLVDDETLFQFYAERISEPISDVRSFIRWLKERGGDEFLRMKPQDLLRTTLDEEAISQFPDTLKIAGTCLPLTYRFEPGHEEDGATLHVPAHLLPRIPAQALEWLVPGLLPEKIGFLLKALPKAYRKQLIPIQQTAQRLSEQLLAIWPGGGAAKEGYQLSLSEALEQAIFKEYHISIPRSAWPESELPPHLRLRLSVEDGRGRVLGQGRDLFSLIKTVPRQQEDNQWKEACQRWERDGIVSWDFENLPNEIILNPHDPGPPRLAYPGLVAAAAKPLLDNDSVSLRLFPTPQEAARATRMGLLTLYAISLREELRQLKKSWEPPPNWKRLLQPIGHQQNFHELLLVKILQGIFPVQDGRIPSRQEFFDQVERARRGSLLIKGRLIMSKLQDLLTEWQETVSFIARFRRLAAGNALLSQLLQEIETEEVGGLLPPDFLIRYEMDRLVEIPRYLKAIRLRVERAYAAPQKDLVKAKQLAPYRLMLKEALAMLDSSPSPDKAEQIEEFRWMIEEFKISLFAQEVGTAYPISAKRLDKKWEEICGGKSRLLT